MIGLIATAIVTPNARLKKSCSFNCNNDGYVITRKHKGFEFIQTWLAEDNKTIYLHEKWATKEECR